MKGLYIPSSRWDGDGPERMWIMIAIGIMTFFNSCILMSAASTPQGTPVWSILTLNLVPVFMILFWLFTTSHKPEPEDKKQYIRIEKPSDIDLREKYKWT
jgi:hypothetical protein